MALNGDIALRARGEIPETWDALARSTVYGELLLQLRIDFVKFQLFGTVCDAHLEATSYSPAQLMLAGKRVAISIIPGGADFWSNQMITETTTGTNEVRQFPDRINSLWKIYARLATEVAELEGGIPGLQPKRRMTLPQVDTTGPMITTDPSQFDLTHGSPTIYSDAWRRWFHL